MKKYNVYFATLIAAMVLSTISCQTSSSEKLENAKEESAIADKNLNDAQAEYLADMENFKKETNVKISANEQSLKEFQARKASSKEEAKAEYDQKIKDLEQKNTDMKRKLDEYKIESKDQWNSFKEEFNHDMEELGAALKDLTIDNAD